MISKDDCLSILVSMDNLEKNINVDTYIKKLLISKEVPFEVLKFISVNRGMEVSNFYEVLRKSYNKKKSPLYANIVKDLDKDNIQDVLVTLASLQTQILLYANKLENNEKQLFFKQVRAEELSRVLHDYFVNGDAEQCVNLLKIIKSDLLVLEYALGRREAD